MPEGVAAGDQQHRPAVVLERLEHVLLRLQTRIRQSHGFSQCAGTVALADHNHPALRRLQIIDDRQQFTRSQIHIAADFLGRQLLGRRSVLAQTTAVVAVAPPEPTSKQECQTPQTTSFLGPSIVQISFEFGTIMKRRAVQWSGKVEGSKPQNVLRPLSIFVTTPFRNDRLSHSC